MRTMRNTRTALLLLSLGLLLHCVTSQDTGNVPDPTSPVSAAPPTTPATTNGRPASTSVVAVSTTGKGGKPTDKPTTTTAPSTPSAGSLDTQSPKDAPSTITKASIHPPQITGTTQATKAVSTPSGPVSTGPAVTSVIPKTSPSETSAPKTSDQPTQDKSTAAPQNQDQPIPAPKAQDQQTSAPKAQDQQTSAPKAQDQQTQAPNAQDQQTLAPNAQDQQTLAPNAQDQQTLAPLNLGSQTSDQLTQDKSTSAPQNQDQPTLAPKTQDQQTLDPKTQDQQTSAPKAQDQQTLAPKTQDQQTSAPKAQDQQTLAPKTQDQQTSAPKTQEQQTLAPKAQDQQTSAPKAQDQQTLAPKAQDQQTRAPQTRTPETVAPQTKPNPDIIGPAGVPDIRVPNIPKEIQTKTYMFPLSTMATPQMSKKYKFLTSGNSEFLRRGKYELQSSENAEDDDEINVAACRKLMGTLTKGNCTVTWSGHGKNIHIEDVVDICAAVDAQTANNVWDDIKEIHPPAPPTKPGDKTTLIAILASCGALLAMIIGLGIYATHHRKPYHENQQHLTEELHTVENGYHDNPTLEVMEVQPEMQEKKAPPCNEFNDSWIVPMETMNKEVLPDEEDTHL